MRWNLWWMVPALNVVVLRLVFDHGYEQRFFVLGLLLLYQLVLPRRTASWAQGSLLVTVYPLILVMMSADGANPWRATLELILIAGLASLLDSRWSAEPCADCKPVGF